ncbi:MAG: hypothetical protein L6Q97_05620 [Thermoanaerobaculia bacterium]|nr:hypothetical protein [Thermoanaerobaculia bacterium]
MAKVSGENKKRQSYGVYDFIFHKDQFFLLNETGLHRSDDNCQSWEKLGAPASYYFHEWGDSLLIIGYTGIFSSTDKGLSWKPVLLPAPSKALVLQNFKHYGDSLFAHCNYGTTRALLYTPDRGASCDTILPPQWMYAGPLTDYFIYQDRLWITKAGTPDDVYYSDNGGKSWTATGLQDGYFKSFTRGEHFFLMGKQMMYSADAGAHWHNSSGLPTGESIRSIAADKQGKWYAAMNTSGIFVSSDFGATWKLFDHPGLPDFIALYPIDNFLYGHRNSSGLWRQILFPTPTTAPGDQGEFRLRLFPNPASQAVSISLPEGQAVCVYDAFGSKIGEYDSLPLPGPVRIEIGSWPPGCYFFVAGQYVGRLIKH